MSYFTTRVKWFEPTGEECEEEFPNKSAAETFVKFNNWSKGVHPKIHEYEIMDDGTEYVIS